jgi:hypothetical protein
LSSYAANAQLFCHSPSLPATIQDGASNTIAFAEHYAYGCGTDTYVFAEREGFKFIRRATFADGGPDTRINPGLDYIPITSRTSPPQSKWLDNSTFQAAPTVAQCDGHMANTPYRSGMLTALADGSCRTLSPGMSPTTYWGAVTPAAGETLGPDW